MRRDAPETDVEFLPPDSRAFGDTGQVDFVGFGGDDASGTFDLDEEPRSRWLTVVAAAVVCVFVAAGVVAAAPWADDAVATPTPTTVTTTTVERAPPTTADIMAGVAFSPAGWVVDDLPAQLQFSGAWSQAGVGGPPQPLDIWATTPFAPWSSSWIVVRWLDGGVGGSLVEGGTRLTVGGRAAVLSTDPAGVTTVTAHADDSGGSGGPGIVIRSSGATLGELVDLLGRIERDTTTTSGIAYTGTAEATSGMTLVWTGVTSPRAIGAFGDVDAATGLYDPSNGSGMQIEHRLVDASLLPYMPLLVTAVPLPDDVAGDMRAIGRPVTVYSVGPTEDERWLLTAWVDGDRAVTISSYDLDESVVLAAMAAAQPASDDEWRTLVEKSQRGINFDEGGPSPSASLEGTLDDGTVWTSSFSETYFWIQTGQQGWYSPVRVPDGATVRHFADVDVGVVAVTVRWPNSARTMRVTVGAAAPVDVPLVQIGDLPMFAGLWVQRDVAPVSVELVDAAGAAVPVG